MEEISTSLLFTILVLLICFYISSTRPLVFKVMKVVVSILGILLILILPLTILAATLFLVGLIKQIVFSDAKLSDLGNGSKIFLLIVGAFCFLAFPYTFCLLFDKNYRQSHKLLWHRLMAKAKKGMHESWLEYVDRREDCSSLVHDYEDLLVKLDNTLTPAYDRLDSYIQSSGLKTFGIGAELIKEFEGLKACLYEFQNCMKKAPDDNLKLRMECEMLKDIKPEGSFSFAYAKILISQGVNARLHCRWYRRVNNKMVSEYHHLEVAILNLAARFNALKRELN